MSGPNSAGTNLNVSGNGKEFNATADAELLRKAMDRLGLCFECSFLTIFCQSLVQSFREIA